MKYELERKARKKVKSIKRLYIHCALYSILGVFFFLLNIATDPFDMWFFFPMLPWGVVLALHYLLVQGIPGTNLLTKQWEEDEYEKQLDRLQNNSDFKSQGFLPYEDLDELDSLKLNKVQKIKSKMRGEDFV